MDELIESNLFPDVAASRRHIDPFIISELASVKTEMVLRRAHLSQLSADYDRLLLEINELRKDISRIKGFAGGMAFVFSVIGVVAGLSISYWSGFP